MEFRFVLRSCSISLKARQLDMDRCNIMPYSRSVSSSSTSGAIGAGQVGRESDEPTGCSTTTAPRSRRRTRHAGTSTLVALCCAGLAGHTFVSALSDYSAESFSSSPPFADQGPTEFSEEETIMRDPVINYRIRNARRQQDLLAASEDHSSWDEDEVVRVSSSKSERSGDELIRREMWSLLQITADPTPIDATRTTLTNYWGTVQKEYTGVRIFRFSPLRTNVYKNSSCTTSTTRCPHNCGFFFDGDSDLPCVLCDAAFLC